MIAVFIFLIVILSGGVSGASKRIEYPKLLELIESNQVDRVSIRGTSLVGRYKDSKISLADYPVRAYDFETTIGADFYDTVIKMAASEKNLSVDEVSVHDLDFEIEYLAPITTPWYLEILPYLIPIILLGVMWWFIMRQQAGAGGGKVMNFGKSRAAMVDPSKNKVTFANVAGADEEKEELKEIVDFLKNPKHYVDLGARIPKGVLLVGPPGTGKTLLAKAVAGEANVPFFSISGSDFVEMFVGVGASRVRDLFEQAKRNAPSIVFIDEIDAVGRHRGAGLGGGHDEREQTLNQLLVEMDGFATNEGVIVMAATNRRDILDPALLRPGRFDRQVTVNYPDLNGRVEILKVHAKGKPLAEDVNLENIAKRTPYATGADLENIMNEGAIQAAREKQTKITQAHLIEAVERIQMGPEKRSHKVLEEDRRITAYHEAGHAIVGHFLPLCDEVHMITVVPRGQAAGLTLSLPEKELDHMGKQKLLQTISMALGGRAAESLTQDDICTGAVSDLKRATEVARSMVTRFGMSEKLGNVYLGSDQEIFVGMEFGQSREYSESTAAMIDEEVRAILDSAYDQSVSILRDHLDQLHGLAKMLIEKETVTREDFLQYIDPEKAAELMAAKAAMEAGEESAEEEKPEEEAKEENE
ncbi:MAG: ATP-dependent metallopeptidase FtsH/Yme1/Tma family protein [Clostridiales bacterium]|nr:ATP-dependent metallopeptidase FtsH/Yme1/Tma family protein [Clostridiales bacterium]